MQTQYVKDFPFLRAVKGMNNFPCLVKEDFVNGGIYTCSKCEVLDTFLHKKITNVTECSHKAAAYGPCRSAESYEHYIKTCQRCQNKGATDVRFHSGCRYRTYPEDYEVKLKNTIEERIEIGEESRGELYQNWYSIADKDNINFWMHARNFDSFEKIRGTFTSCPYFDQLNKGLLASHSIFNYANFLAFLRLKNDPLPRRDLLVLDEGHSIESQLLGQVEISISKNTLQKYIRKDIFANINYGYDDSIAEKWLVLLRTISQELKNTIPELNSDETRLDVMEHLQKIKLAIDDINENPNNWIVSNLVKENGKTVKIEFKPLDLSGYCRKLFEKCSRILVMSASILDVNAFCRSVGLDINEVKFIQADSDFPIQNRPIYPLNTAYLNYRSLQEEIVQRKIANAVNTIMAAHNNEKGIIHCTSYAQVHFIQKYLSGGNKRRLLETDPERFNGREEVIIEHFTSANPTVLISPSLHTGLDLKDERSRFQVIVKVPFPSRSDRWIEAKRKKDQGWYNWQTAIRLVQAYGRSVRSKDDWAITYVLDGSFKSFIERNGLPNWYAEAIQPYSNIFEENIK